MSSVDLKQFLRDNRNFIILVEKKRGQVWRGMLYHGSNASVERFDTLLEMAYLVEEICDRNGIPKALVNQRYFKNASPLAQGKPKSEGQKSDSLGGVLRDYAVFKLCLEHRYCASWQGWTQQLGQRERVAFGSYLELMEQMIERFPGDFLDKNMYGSVLKILAGRGIPQIGEDGTQWYVIPEASYQIQILFRENHSWQGIVRWLEARENVCFRSFLELAKLTDSLRFTDSSCKELQLG